MKAAAYKPGPLTYHGESSRGKLNFQRAFDLTAWELRHPCRRGSTCSMRPAGMPALPGHVQEPSTLMPLRLDTKLTIRIEDEQRSHSGTKLRDFVMAFGAEGQ